LTTQVFETTAQAYRQAEVQSQGTDVLLNTEMCREAGELERTWLTTAAALGTNNLVSEVFTGVNLDRTAQLREQTLLRLVEATTNHTMVSARKVAIQALRAFVDAWMADSNVPRQDVVPGFTQFVLERICTECCIVPIMRGDLNLSDAVSVTVLNESNAILSIAFARQREALEVVMTQFFPAILPGIDQARVAQIMTEYARILVSQGGIKSTNSNSKSARALADVLHTELKRAHSVSMPTELQPRLAKRGT
jgi:exportin-T